MDDDVKSQNKNKAQFLKLTFCILPSLSNQDSMSRSIAPSQEVRTTFSDI